MSDAGQSDASPTPFAAPGNSSRPRAFVTYITQSGDKDRAGS